MRRGGGFEGSWGARWGRGQGTDGGQALRPRLSDEPGHIVGVRVGQGQTDGGSDREARGGIIGR